jgi:heme-degrading monooxygenase HmoA
MYTRNVSLKLKANSAPEFTRTVEKEIIPLLRKQKGFQDEITLVAPESNEAVAISFWDKKEDAEAYNREKYPEILKTLSRMVEGTPRVESFEVANSTSHKIAAKAAA